ncbi:MAG: hypothetical protein KDI33_00400 [Halioglobus sp.]|nr:hypothetical protein [Halioglobus sp.]
MNLGDVSGKTVPKMSLVAPARNGGVISMRTFIPHRVHEAIGVLGAVSVASASLLPRSVAQQVCGVHAAEGSLRLDVEHPTGFFTMDVEVAGRADTVEVKRAALLRTTRTLMKGAVMIPAALWGGR